MMALKLLAAGALAVLGGLLGVWGGVYALVGACVGFCAALGWLVWYVARKLVVEPLAFLVFVLCVIYAEITGREI